MDRVAEQPNVLDVHENQALINWILLEYSMGNSRRLQQRIRNLEDKECGMLWHPELRPSNIFPTRIDEVISSFALVNPQTILSMAGLPVSLADERTEERIMIVQRGYPISPNSIRDIFQIGAFYVSPEEERVMITFSRGNAGQFLPERNSEGSFSVEEFCRRNPDYSKEDLLEVLSGLRDRLDIAYNGSDVILMGISNPFDSAVLLSTLKTASGSATGNLTRGSGREFIDRWRQNKRNGNGLSASGSEESRAAARAVPENELAEMSGPVDDMRVSIEVEKEYVPTFMEVKVRPVVSFPEIFSNFIESMLENMLENKTSFDFSNKVEFDLFIQEWINTRVIGRSYHQAVENIARLRVLGDLETLAETRNEGIDMVMGIIHVIPEEAVAGNSQFEDSQKLLFLGSGDLGRGEFVTYAISLDSTERNIFNYFDYSTRRFDIESILEDDCVSDPTELVETFRRLDYRLGLAGASQYREQIGLVDAIEEVASRIRIDILNRIIPDLTEANGFIHRYKLVQALAEHIPRAGVTIRQFIDRNTRGQEKWGQDFSLLFSPQEAWEAGEATFVQYDSDPTDYLNAEDLIPRIIDRTGCRIKRARKRLAQYIRSQLPGIAAYGNAIKIPTILEEVIIARVSREILEYDQGMSLVEVAREISRNLGRSEKEHELVRGHIHEYANEVRITLRHSVPIPKDIAREIIREVTKRLTGYSRRKIARMFQEDYEVSIDTLNGIIRKMVKGLDDKIVRNSSGKIGEDGKNFLFSELRKIAEIRGWKKRQSATEAN